MTERQKVILSGWMGLAASVLVGAGEFLLHFDPLARYGDGYAFFRGVTSEQATIGHFIAVLGVPFYILGAWHLKVMLRPASYIWSSVGFFALSYGFIIGAVWIGSRASAATFAAVAGQPETGPLMSLYDLRYESLLTLVRLAMFAFSAIFICLVMTGKTYYARWIAVLNPVLLIVVCFLVFWLAPAVGRFVMPIALNVAFLILFSVSIVIASRSFERTSE